jgi:hypothetical protein
LSGGTEKKKKNGKGGLISKDSLKLFSDFGFGKNCDDPY